MTIIRFILFVPFVLAAMVLLQFFSLLAFGTKATGTLCQKIEEAWNEFSC